MTRYSFKPVGHLVIALLSLLVSAAPLQAQQTPDESLATLHAADGVSVSLWASEPMVNNPTSMDVDSRGRVWISEGLNYRMKQRQFENMQRIDKADRIKILSDTDGDGKADSVTIFADDIFPVPLGIAVEEIWKDGKQTGTRVYIGNSPDLLVLEDTDGDDVADRRTVLLTGFRGVDSDHGLHGMTFGPDGKLYFTVGDARYGADRVQNREVTFDVTDRSGRRLSCSNFGTTLRVNRDGTQLEVLSSGHRNNYEAAVDSFGNVFGSDNDDDGNRGARMYWVMEGGQYGYQHPQSSRHWAEELPGIIPKLAGTGNAAPCGLCVYEGDHLPQKYFGAIFQIDSGTRQINVHPLRRHGAGFRSDYEVLLKGDDAWFRPVDLAVAPDGSVLVCDWYDAGVGGNRFSDQTTGRIYRLISDNKAALKNGRRMLASNPVVALTSPNAAIRLAARDILVSRGAAARAELQKLFQNGQPHERARALCVLHDLPQTGTADTIAALRDSDARIRETALQLLGRDATREQVLARPTARTVKPPAAKHLDQLLPLASDPDAGVRRALLMAIRNVPSNILGKSLTKLAASWDGHDRYYLEALRAALINRDARELQLLFDELANEALENGWDASPVAVPPYYPIGTNDAFLRPGDQLPPTNSASRVAGLAWALQSTEALPALDRILSSNTSPAVEEAVTIALGGIDSPDAGRLLLTRLQPAEVSADSKHRILAQLGTGIAGPWQALSAEPSFNDALTKALADPSLQAVAVECISQCRLTAFGGRLMTIAEDDSQPVELRAAAVSALGTLKHAPAKQLTDKLVDSVRGEPSGGLVGTAALDAAYALSSGGDGVLLTRTLTDVEMPSDLRRRSLQLLTVSLPGVSQALKMREEKSFPTDLDSELAFLLHNHADRRVRGLAETAMPVSATAGKKKVHSAADVLTLGGDAARGRKLFETHQEANCFRCHRTTGEGPLVGPDLASIGLKYGDKELLYHIQNPSGAINYSFVAHTFVLENGQVLTGLVTDRKDGQITIGIATGQKVSFAAKDVDEEVPQSVSLMPDGLVSGLTPQQVADLVEFLLSLRQGDAGQQRPQTR
jgi:putative membrane-bound dehydrogenase-like protein